ncbi:hypothetical protein M9458_054287 [Cirrhinus mrigala]|uniref:Uncharacterized protein n=1 Tax=Cirrhinus mrigala TaxID=683832 RepID=A0ABD0MJY6_CIRMR
MAHQMALSIIGGLGGKWWAGLWAWSGTDEIILGTDGEWRSVSCQCPLHKGSETIFGQWRSPRGVQASITECRVAGEMSNVQEQSGMVLELSFPLLQQKEEVFQAKERIHTTQRKQKWD